MFPYKDNDRVTAFPPSELSDFIGTTQLSDFLCGVWLTHLLSLVLPYSLLLFLKDRQDLPSCYNISMCNVPRSSTPKRFLLSRPYEIRNVAFCTVKYISPLNWVFRSSIPSTNWLSAHYLTVYT